MVRLLIIAFLIIDLSQTVGITQEEEDKGFTETGFILEAKKYDILIKYDIKEKKLIISNPDYSAILAYTDCSSPSIDRFMWRLQEVEGETLSLNIEGSYIVTINEKQLHVLKGGPLGRFLDKIGSKTFTLDTTIASSCSTD